MNDIDHWVSRLSPEKRVLLEKRLLKKTTPDRNQNNARSAIGPCPLSFGQESLWFLDQLESNSPLYNLPQAWRLRGPLNIEALRKAFESVVHRHESLRTNFVLVDHKPLQIVANKKFFPLPVTDLRRLSKAERWRDAELFTDKEARRPFDLTKDVMLRASLLQLDDDENILCMSVHHIAADAWSLDLLMDELSVFYQNICAAKETSLPEIHFQYSDFARCQRERFQGEVAAKQLAYWKERLAGELPVLELPTDRPRPAEQTYRGALRFFTLPNALVDALKELSRRENVTVYSTLLAAFQILLQRYSRQDDILLGTPVGTRNRSDTEKLIGYFINTVVLRSDLSGDPIFTEALQAIHRHVLGALTNREISLEQLAEKLKVPRHPGRNPIIQVLFQYLPAPMKLPELDGITAERLPVETHTSKLDLSLTLRDASAGLGCEFEYNIDLFDAATIDRMAGHYQTLLQAIVGNPSQKISRLPLLTQAEERQLLLEWNATEVPFPTSVSIPDLLERQSAVTPDAIAVICENEQLTFCELNDRSNRLARYLQKLGAQPDTPVAICMERSIEMLVAVHGALKSGSPYLPLDPDYPQERLQFMLKDAQALVLLTRKHLIGNSFFETSKICCVDSEWETIECESGENLPTKPDPGDLAYVIYTSGSTGQPKGVMVSHAAICNHLFWMQHQFPLSVGDRILQKTSFSFDVAVWELLAPVVSGASLVMANPGGHRDVAYLARLISGQKITILQTVPSALRALIEDPEIANCTSLKYVICGGEEMPADLFERFPQILNARLSNCYGPTEACIDTTYWVGQHENKKIAPPIGRPIANANVYILDPHLQPVPIGVPGELCVGGCGLARGYLHQPELTAEKFISNPFAPGTRLFKTGDLVRYLADGNIEFLGRIDHQVKIRGFRIELGEIEAALCAHPEIREAVVVARENKSGEKFLVAYLVAPGSSADLFGELRGQLKTKLPEYMVPAAFVALERLPLTPNGKVDLKSLPSFEFKSDDTAFEAPRTFVEEQLAEIWNDVLGLKQVGIHDNFFELGGHSLLAAQVVARMRAVSGKEVPLRDFFQSPTVAGLGAIVENSDVQILNPATSISRLPRKKMDQRLQNTVQMIIVVLQGLLAEIQAFLPEVSLAFL